MKNYDIKLIGLDLDGTTLTSDKVLTERTKRDLEKAIEKEVVVLPATGRARKAIPDYLKKIKGIRYILTSNGAAIVDLDKDEVIYEKRIAWDRALELFDILEGYGTYYDIYADGVGWCEGRFLDHVDDYNIRPVIKKMILDSRLKIDDLREKVRREKLDVEKINMFFKSDEERQVAFSALKEIPDVNVCHSIEYNLEINHKECNKGIALMGLGEILGIAPEQIMACGDGLNDIDMIRQAGLGVAMENAEPEVKEVADYITLHNDQEGVAYAIERFVLKSGE